MVVAFEQVAAEDVVKYGIAKPRGPVGELFELEDLVEKPELGEAPSNLAVAARYVFSPAIFDALRETSPGKGGEIQLTDAIHQVLQQGGKGIGLQLPDDQRRYDIGNFDSYFRAFLDFALSDPEYGAQAEAHVRDRINRSEES